MSTSATCPKCCRMVSLPVTDQAESVHVPAALVDIWVRCPLCRSEFRLQEAIDFVPPALVIISQPQSDELAHVALADAEPGDDFVPIATGVAPTTGFAATTGFAPTTGAPGFKPTGPLANQNIPDLLINPERGAFAPGRQTSAPPHPGFVPSDVQVAVNESDTAEDFKLSPETPAARQMPMPSRSGAGAQFVSGEEPWNAAAGGTNVQTFFPPLPPKRGRGYRRAKRRNPVIELLMIIVGGAVGCVIAFGVLLWGFKIDPFDLAKYLPPKMVPEQLRKTDSVDTEEVARGKGISISRNHPVDAGSSQGPQEPPSAPGGDAKVPSGETLPGSATPSSSAVPSNSVPPISMTPTSNGQIDAGAPAMASDTHPVLPPLPDATATANAVEENDGPKTDTVYSLKDVTEAIRAAAQAEAVLKAARSDKNIASDSPAMRDVRKQYYMALAKLAETVTLLRTQNDDREMARSTTAAFLQHVADERSKLDDLGLLASQWMDVPGRAYRGIALAGTVQSIEPIGKQFCTTVKLFNRDKTVPVITAKKPDVGANDAVLVMGTLVPDPAQSLPQYTGRNELVVWGAVVAKPEAETTKSGAS